MKKKGEKLPAIEIEGESETEFTLVDGKIVPKPKKGPPKSEPQP